MKGIDNLSNKLQLNFRYIFKNSFWVLSENSLSLLFGLLIVYATANFLDPNVVGQYKYLVSLAAIVSSFTISGISYAVTREVALGYNSFFHFATNKSLKWSILPISITLVIAGYYFLNANTTYATSFFLATFFTIMIGNFSLYRSYLSGKEDFKQMAIYGNVVLILGTLFSIATFYFTSKLTFLVLGTLGAQFAILLVIYLKVKSSIEKKDINIDLINKFNNYVYSQSFINIIAVGATHMDKVVLFQFLGPVDLAVYTFVTVFTDKVKGLLKSFAGIFFPKFVKRDILTIKDKMFKESLVVGLFLVFCFFVTMLITPYVYYWFLPKYTDHIYLATIYTVSIFSILALVPYNAMQAKNLKKGLYFYEIINSFIQIIFVIIGVIYYGLLGAIVAKVIASLVGTCILYVIFFQRLIFSKPLKTFFD